MNVIANAGSKSEVSAHFPCIFGEAVEHLHPEIIGACAVARVKLIDCLNEARIVIPCCWISVTNLASKRILRPILEVNDGSRTAIVVNSTALKQIDHDLMY